MNLYDYVYVDLARAVSLYSQLTGGVVELRETHDELSSTEDNKRKYDFKVFKYDAGGTSASGAGIKETIKPHHSLLQELERELVDAGHLVDLSALPDVSLKNDDIRGQLKSALCIKCKGRVVIEDYERIKEIAGAFPDVVALINRSREESVKESEEYQVALAEIKELEQSGGDRNEKTKNKAAAKELRSRLDTLVATVGKIGDVPDWILRGMKTWIDAFLPGIINVRIYPNEDVPDEHVFGHLDESGFIIGNKAAFHFTYGSLPTEEFSMIGIITSVPEKLPGEFDPLTEFKKSDLGDNEGVESGFRGVFRGFDGLESMIRTIRYPRVLVHPLLVYREAVPNKALKPTR